MKKILAAAVTAVLAWPAPAQAAPVQNEILFLMDSSGSMFDTGYAKWQSSIDWVRNFVDQTHRADGSNAYGIINFSGGSASQSVAQVAAANRMNLVYGTGTPSTDFYTGNPVPGAQDKASLDAFIGGMGPADFRGGFTWTDEALTLAYNTFQTSPNISTNRFIFLLTDGSITSGHYPVIASGGATIFESDTLQAIRSDDISLSVVTFDPLITDLQDYLAPLVSAPGLLLSVNDLVDFNEILPPAAVTAMPAPVTVAFLALGVAFFAVRNRKSAPRARRHKNVI